MRYLVRVLAALALAVGLFLSAPTDPAGAGTGSSYYHCQVAAPGGMWLTSYLYYAPTNRSRCEYVAGGPCHWLGYSVFISHGTHQLYSGYIYDFYTC